MDKTIEGNKLIAEFVDFDLQESKKYKGGQAQYHTSWDWLMPVVEKIRYIEDTIDNSTFFTDEFKNLSIFQTSIFAGIEYVWNKVIEFITWYNSQSKTNNQ